MSQKMRKVSVLANGFFRTRGASPFHHPPSRCNLLNSTIIRCSENWCCSVSPCVCSLALMISKGCVRAVATIPDKTPAGSLCQPMALNSQQSMQCRPPKAPSLMQLDSPPLKNPPKPSLRRMSSAAAPTDAYPWKYASSKRVQMMFKGLVRRVLANRDKEEFRKLCLAVISSRSNARSPQKQMQHPKPALSVAAASPLQKPLTPSAQQMQRQDERNEEAGEDPTWTAASSLGGSMRAILMFSKGCSRRVESTPLSIPKSPFSLIIPDQLCIPTIISPTLSKSYSQGDNNLPRGGLQRE